MEEVNIKDLLEFFVKKIPLMIIIIIIVFSLGMGYTLYLKTPLYSGNTTLILVKKEVTDNTSSLTQNDITFNQNLVTTYSELMKSRRVLNQVIEDLTLDYSANELAKKLTVSSISDTEIIKISVSDEDSEVACQIADKIAEVFTHEVMEIYNLENVSIIDMAEVQSKPYNMDLTKDIIIYLGIGLIISSFIVLIIFYTDTSVKSTEDIEKHLNISVIGTIPLRKGVR